MNTKELIKVGLQYYKESNKAEIEKLSQRELDWNTKEVEINGAFFEAKYTDNEYILYVEGKPVVMGAVDNGDFEETISNDEKTFGMVIKAMQELETRGEVISYLDNEEETISFLKQFEFVLSFCTVRVGGKTVPLTEFMK